MNFQFIDYLARLFSSDQRSTWGSKREQEQEQEQEQEPDVVGEKKEEEKLAIDPKVHVENSDSDAPTNRFELRQSVPIAIPQRGWRQKEYGIGTY